MFKRAADTFDPRNTWDFSTSSTFWEVPYVQVAQLSVSNLKDAFNLQCRFDTLSALSQFDGFAAYMLEVVQYQCVGGTLLEFLTMDHVNHVWPRVVRCDKIDKE